MKSSTSNLKKALLELNADIDQQINVNDFDEKYRTDIKNIVLLLNVMQNLIENLIVKMEKESE